MIPRVLVVEDDDAIREVVTVIFETVAGWEVEAVSGCAQALTRAVADPPDAILLDLRAPGADAPATLAHLQADARTRDVPVVLITANPETAKRRRWDRLGVAGVLAKPFDPLALPGQVADLLGWPR